MDYVFIVILGLVIGSFLNVCIYKIPKEESILFVSLHCTKCRKRLNIVDLAPILSYIFFKGRCRYCSEKISIRYSLIESINAILYLIIYLNFGMTLIALKYCILVSILIVIGMVDYDTKFVYTCTTVFGIIIGIIFIIAEFVIYKDNILYLILGGAIGYVIMWGIVFFTKGMGEGDVEIAAVCGLFLGFKLIVLNILIAIIIGGILGISILLLKLKKAEEKIAFGPCIAIGGVISMLFGNEIIYEYLSIIY